MAAIHPIKSCACGCGEAVRSRNPSARYRRGHRARSQFGSPESRFWANVKIAEGCWLWQGRPGGDDGYGEIHVGGETLTAHRYSWQLHNGLIPGGLQVLHQCDVHLCVNPAHLFLGTPADNMADKVAKGRQARGESHGGVKLTALEVLRIRWLHDHSTPVKEIAAALKVSPDLIYRIVKRKLWKHLAGKE